MKPYESVELSRVAEFKDDDYEPGAKTYIEVLEPGEEPECLRTFYSVYVRRNSLAECVADCGTYEHAHLVAHALADQARVPLVDTTGEGEPRCASCGGGGLEEGTDKCYTCLQQQGYFDGDTVIIGDQPMTCPACGARTEFKQKTPTTQHHICPDCGRTFTAISEEISKC